MSERAIQPIYLFADSQLLFWRRDGSAFIDRIRDRQACPSPRAVYIGASNGDAPEFYALFAAAMDGIDVRDCYHVRSTFSDEDAAALTQADIILLAGGDVEAGWSIIESTKMAELVRQRYLEGATLIGVSAGAVQLGTYAAIEVSDVEHRLLDTLKLVPFIISAHDEDRDWSSLSAVVQMLEGAARGIGIPKGAGLVYHPDQSVEIIRSPAHEYSMAAGKLLRNLLLPSEDESE